MNVRYCSALFLPIANGCYSIDSNVMNVRYCSVLFLPTANCAVTGLIGFHARSTPWTYICLLSCLVFSPLPISYKYLTRSYKGFCEIMQDLTKILASSYSDLIKIVSHVLLKGITSRKSRKTWEQHFTQTEILFFIANQWPTHTTQKLKTFHATTLFRSKIKGHFNFFPHINFITQIFLTSKKLYSHISLINYYEGKI